jgi:hypothetical protein
MDLTLSFLFYASIYRLAIVAVGVVAIVLGYRLFIRGVMPGGNTEARVVAGDVKLTLSNAAPGTCFALFGAFVICVMLYQTNPELLLEQQEADGSVAKAQVRGGEHVGLGGVSQERTAHEIDATIKTHSDALAAATSLDEAAVAMRGLAGAYLADQDGIDTKLAAKALALTEIVYQLDDQSPENLATMARARWHLGEQEEALKAMKAAADRDGRFTVHLKRMERGEL